MDIVIIGLPQSGKTNLFNALTLGKSDASGASGSPTEMHIGMVKVPDPRLDHLGEIYHPRKVVLRRDTLHRPARARGNGPVPGDQRPVPEHPPIRDGVPRGRASFPERLGAPSHRRRWTRPATSKPCSAS